ncbi:MAG: flagellar basal body-associated FliL family protein [Myxococcales bacterium]|nr:flagellar basal body-associated FliL family protein [Myxococcales bacterium]
MRDGVLTLLGDKTVEQVQSAEGKQALRQGIAAQVEEILGGKKPRGVFFTEFVVQ